MKTDAKKTQKIYLVSFGGSDKYILRDYASGKESKLTRIEAELNAFLKSKFPDESFAYFTSPKVQDISNPDDYKGYPELDAKAIENIKGVLTDEVENLESQQLLNRNAPFANVNPGAAGIPNIL